MKHILILLCLFGLFNQAFTSEQTVPEGLVPEGQSLFLRLTNMNSRSLFSSENYILDIYSDNVSEDSTLSSDQFTAIYSELNEAGERVYINISQKVEKDHLSSLKRFAKKFNSTSDNGYIQRPNHGSSIAIFCGVAGSKSVTEMLVKYDDFEGEMVTVYSKAHNCAAAELHTPFWQSSAEQAASAYTLMKIVLLPIARKEFRAVKAEPQEVSDELL